MIMKLSGALDIPENRLFIKIGKVKMDLAATPATNRKEASKILTALSEEQWKELLTYLACLRVKAYITD